MDEIEDKTEETQKAAPSGIRSALRKIEEKEGAAAALATAKKWASALDEMHEVACPTMHTLRPGGPQKLCTMVLLVAVNQYIEKNPLTISGN